MNGDSEILNVSPYGIVVSRDADKAATTYLDNIKLLEMKKMHSNALRLPYKMGAAEYDIMRELLGNRIAFLSDRPSYNSHPIAANLQAIAYQRCLDQARLPGIQNRAIDIGGTALRTPKEHHLCTRINNMREEARYVNANVINAENQLCLLNTAYRHHLCIHGAEQCKYAAPYAYAINVYGITFATIAKIFEMHGLVQMDMWMFMPHMLADINVTVDQTYYTCVMHDKQQDKVEDYQAEFDNPTTYGVPSILKLHQTKRRQVRFGLCDASNVYEHDYLVWRKYLTTTSIACRNGGISIEIIEQFGTFTNFRFTRTWSHIPRNIRCYPLGKIMKNYVIVPSVTDYIRKGAWVHSKASDMEFKYTEHQRYRGFDESDIDYDANRRNTYVYEKFYIIDTEFVSRLLSYGTSLKREAFCYETFAAMANASRNKLYYEKTGQTMLVHKGLSCDINVYNAMTVDLFLIAALQRYKRTQDIAKAMNRLKNENTFWQKFKNFCNDLWRHVVAKVTMSECHKLITENQEFSGILAELRPLYFNDIYFDHCVGVEEFQRLEKADNRQIPQQKRNPAPAKVQAPVPPPPKLAELLPPVQLVKPLPAVPLPALQLHGTVVPVPGDGACAIHALKHYGVDAAAVLSADRLAQGWLNEDDIEAICKHHRVSWTIHMDGIPTRVYRHSADVRHINIDFVGSPLGGHWQPYNCTCSRNDYYAHDAYLGDYRNIPMSNNILYVNCANHHLSDGAGQAAAFAAMFPNYKNGIKLPIGNVHFHQHNGYHLALCVAHDNRSKPDMAAIHRVMKEIFDALSNYANANDLVVYLPAIGTNIFGNPLCCFKKFCDAANFRFVHCFMNANAAATYNRTPKCTHGGFDIITVTSGAMVNNMKPSVAFSSIVAAPIPDHMRLKFTDIMLFCQKRIKVNRKSRALRYLEVSGAPGHFKRYANDSGYDYTVGHYTEGLAFIHARPDFTYSNLREFHERIKNINCDVVISDIMIDDANVQDVRVLINTAITHTRCRAFIFKTSAQLTQTITATLWNRRSTVYTLKIDGVQPTSGEIYFAVIRDDVTGAPTSVDISAVQATIDVMTLTKQREVKTKCNCIAEFDRNATVSTSINPVDLDLMKQIVCTDDAVDQVVKENVGAYTIAAPIEVYVDADVGVGGAGKTMRLTKTTCAKCTLMISPYRRSVNDVNVVNGHQYANTYVVALNTLARRKFNTIIIDELYAHNFALIAIYQYLQPDAKFIGTGDEKQIHAVDWHGTGEQNLATHYHSEYRLCTKRNPQAVIDMFKAYIPGIHTTRKGGDVTRRRAAEVYKIAPNKNSMSEAVICFTQKTLTYLSNKLDKNIKIMTAAQAHSTTIDIVHLYLSDLNEMPAPARVRYFYTAASRSARQLIMYGDDADFDVVATTSGSELERAQLQTDIMPMDIVAFEEVQPFSTVGPNDEIKIKAPEVPVQAVANILDNIYVQLNAINPSIADINLPVIPENKARQPLSAPVQPLLRRNNKVMAQRMASEQPYNRLYVSSNKLKAMQTFVGRYADKVRNTTLPEAVTSRFYKGIEKWLHPDYKRMVQFHLPTPALIWRKNIDALKRLQSKFPNQYKEVLTPLESEFFTAELDSPVLSFDNEPYVKARTYRTETYGSGPCVAAVDRVVDLQCRSLKDIYADFVESMTQPDSPPNKFKDLETEFVACFEYHCTVSFMMKNQPKEIRNYAFDTKNKYGQGVSAWTKMLNMVCAAYIRHFDDVLPALVKDNVQISYGKSDKDLSAFWAKYGNQMNDRGVVKFCNDFGQFDCTQEKRGTMAISAIYKVFGVHRTVIDLMESMRAKWKLQLVLESKPVTIRAILQGNWQQHSGQIHTLGANTLYNMGGIGMCFDFSTVFAAGFKGDDSFILCSSYKVVIDIDHPIYQEYGFKMKVETPFIPEYIANIVTPFGFVPDILRRISRVMTRLIRTDQDWDEIKISIADCLEVFPERNLIPSLQVLHFFYLQQGISVTVDELFLMYNFLQRLVHSDRSILGPIKEYIFFDDVDTM
jgi:hypothetical protein